VAGNLRSECECRALDGRRTAPRRGSRASSGASAAAFPEAWRKRTWNHLRPGDQSSGSTDPQRLGVGATGPPIAKARARPHQERFDLHPENPGVDPQYPDRADSAPVCGEAITRSQSPLLGLLSTRGVV
jgi:hypothetical protein